MNPAGPRVPPLVALAVGVALWFVPTAVQRVLWLASGGDTVNFDVVLLSRWLAAALLLGFVLAVEKRPLSSVGVRAPRPRDVLILPGSGWATTLTMVAVGSALFVGLYWLRRNLPLCVGAHAFTNLLILANA